MRSLLLSLLLLASAGCGRQEEVRHYRAPKDPVWRMLGAVVPVGGATWFFKVPAPADRLDPVRDEVLSFFRTMRAEAGQLRWTVPAGWIEEKGNAQREATLKFGDLDPKLELSVVRFQGDGGGMLANLNRWRGQLGLDPVGEADLAEQAKKLEGAATDVWVVDLRGPNRPGAGPKAMAKPAEPEPPARTHPPSLDDVRGMFSFERPPSWKENPQPSQGRIFEFSVDDAGGSALITLSALPNGGGTLADNINRWRQQVGLDSLNPSELVKAAAPITFIGSDAWLVEAIGKDSAILAVAALNPQFSIFLKMIGPPATVQAQRGAFMRIAQTFQMKGHHD
ncbi:MAG TPA: hypothetical protein VKW04_08960 [Planctomycetota bacterium]|nr:hypothetical protein [Planctomycetota bacterium]